MQTVLSRAVEIEKLSELLLKGVGLQILAVAAQQTPSSPLLWGWSLLCEAGISAGINLDKTRNTRKVGNIVA